MQFPALSTFSFNSLAIYRSLERLSTGQRINRASDDPAGLIASENLTAQLRSLESEARSLHRADHVGNVAEGALGSVSDLLVEANGLVVSAANDAGMSAEEKQALQGQVDSILSAIDSVGSNSSFAGDRLFDGTQVLTGGSTTHALPELSTSTLGLEELRSGGTMNLENGDLEAAQQALTTAINDVASDRADLGAFQRYSVGARLNSIQVEAENIAAANSVIRDTDFGYEAFSLSRGFVLREASLLALRAHLDQQASVLQLLR